MKVYADGEVIQVTAGECMSLPRGKSHAWLITFDRVLSLSQTQSDWQLIENRAMLLRE
jgi:quercetin dioxygenase-like cupin family protein